MANKEGDIASMEADFARQNARLAGKTADDQERLSREQSRFAERQGERIVALQAAREAIDAFKGANEEEESSKESTARSALSRLESAS
jgi:hypothetical protein